MEIIGKAVDGISLVQTSPCQLGCYINSKFYANLDINIESRFLFADGLVIILPFLLGLMTKLDGMVGTMVVTGEAGEAVVMM